MISKTHTIVIANEGVYYKLIKLIYGADGSIYILSPYHPSKDAIVFIATVNYSLDSIVIPFNELIDVASVEDDEKRLKLSHHLSGLIQVSGQGIISGLDENGKPKGIGIQSWPLESPINGPAFGVTIYGYEYFNQIQRPSNDCHIFSLDKFQLSERLKALKIEAYCFPALHRRFVRKEHTTRNIINLLHPTGRILTLLVAFPPLSCKCQSFIGFEMYFDEGGDNQPVPSFILSSASGNIRVNDKNETLGDAIYCMYPKLEKPDLRNINYSKKPEP